MNMWLLRTAFWNKKIVPKGLFFHECVTSKLKAFKPRKIWSSFGKVNSCRNVSDSRKAAQTNVYDFVPIQFIIQQVLYVMYTLHVIFIFAF